MQPSSDIKHARRQERRRLVKLGRTALARGLSKDIDDEVSIGVLLMLHDKMTEAGNPARAREAAEIAQEVLSRTNAPFERQPDVACRKGCWHCCVTVASVLPPEIFRVAEWVRRNRMQSPQMSPEVLAGRCQTKRGRTLEEMFAARVPCPALVDGACGVHPARPLNCRQFLSTSLAACIQVFGGGSGSVPFVSGAIDRGALLRSLLTAAMKASGLPDTGYELSGALAVALDDATAEQRWLAGENVFADVLVTPRPKDTQDFIDHCARTIERYA